MSETAQRQRVKPGDVVRILVNGVTAERQFVVGVGEVGVLSTRSTDGNGIVHSHRWADVILSEPPKAKPGVRYMDKTTKYYGIGMHDGRIANHMARGTLGSCEFDPCMWEEVTD